MMEKRFALPWGNVTLEVPEDQETFNRRLEYAAKYGVLVKDVFVGSVYPDELDTKPLRERQKAAMEEQIASWASFGIYGSQSDERD